MQFGLYPAKRNKSGTVSVFGGLNRLRRAAEGEMEDMRNMSPFEYPCAAPRGARTARGSAPSAVAAVSAPDTAVEGFTGVGDGHFYYNGVVKSGSYSLTDMYDWSVIRMGDMYVINGCGELGVLIYCYNVSSDSFTEAGVVMDDLIVTAGKDNTGNYLATIRFGYNYVMDYSVTDIYGRVIRNRDFFRRYSSSNDAIGPTNFFSQNFKVGDEISITGFPTLTENVGQVWSFSTTNESVTPQTGKDYSENNTVDAASCRSTDHLSRWQVTDAVVSGFNSVARTIQGKTTYTHYIYLDLYNKNGESIDFMDTSGAAGLFYCSGVKLTSRRRDLSQLAAHQGRLWGVSKSGNMIYASAADKPFSFSAADIEAKYAVRLVSDTPGHFTALCVYNSELVAFKEDGISVVYGTDVRNYGIYTINGAGCTDGRSVCVTPYGVIYLSRRGFYCYSGGAPVRISEKLGKRYISAAAAFAGDIYYAAAQREDGVREILTCDLMRGLWHIQDDTACDGLFQALGGMYMVSDGAVYEMTDDGADDIEWYFTTARSTDGTLDRKAVNEIWIRADVAEGAEFEVYTSSGGEFVKHSAFHSPGLSVFRCPVRAVMGTDLRIRIEGRGRVVIYDIEVKTAQGGRNYKEER